MPTRTLSQTSGNGIEKVYACQQPEKSGRLLIQSDLSSRILRCGFQRVCFPLPDITLHVLSRLEIALCRLGRLPRKRQTSIPDESPPISFQHQDHLHLVLFSVLARHFSSSSPIFASLLLLLICNGLLLVLRKVPLLASLLPSFQVAEQQLCILLSMPCQSTSSKRPTRKRELVEAFEFPHIGRKYPGGGGMQTIENRIGDHLEANFVLPYTLPSLRSIPTPHRARGRNLPPLAGYLATAFPGIPGCPWLAVVGYENDDNEATVG